MRYTTAHGASKHFPIKRALSFLVFLECTIWQKRTGGCLEGYPLVSRYRREWAELANSTDCLYNIVDHPTGPFVSSCDCHCASAGVMKSESAGMHFLTLRVIVQRCLKPKWTNWSNNAPKSFDSSKALCFCSSCCIGSHGTGGWTTAQSFFVNHCSP